MKILLTGNPKKDIASKIVALYPTAHTISRSDDATYTLDLSLSENLIEVAKISMNYDVFINSSLLKDFAQTKLLQYVWTEWKDNNKSGHIISFGSAVDYYFRPDNRLYPIEKRALRDLNRSLSKHVNWFDSKIKTTYFSFGGVDTDKTMHQWSHFHHFKQEDIAAYVQWIIESPMSCNIDELHITPIQPQEKKKMKENKKNVEIKWDSGDERIFLKNEE